MGLLVGLPLKLFYMLFVLLRFAWPVALVLVIRWVVKRIHHQRIMPDWKTTARPEKEKEPDFRGPVYTVRYEDVEEPVISAQPDKPRPFGRDTGWLAVKCKDPQLLIAALDGMDIQLANWESGLAAAGENGRVFVTPRMDGYVLAVGLRQEDRELLDCLGREFEEVQYFVSCAAEEQYGWLKYEQGRLVRDYCWDGREGAVQRDAGVLTPQEIALGFGQFPLRGRECACEAKPVEEDVWNIAAAWSVDPRLENKDDMVSAGWLCRLS